MKWIKLLFSTIVIVCFAKVSYTQIDSKGSSVFGVFAGTSPCSDVAKPLLKIPANAKCDQIAWSLTLNQHPTNHSPTTFKLTREYGYYIDIRTSFAEKYQDFWHSYIDLSFSKEIQS